MTDLRKAAEMALEYLNKVSDWDTTYPIGKAKEELRQALAQPERKWVGLTKRDLEGYSPELKTVLEYIEAILKRKNT